MYSTSMQKCIVEGDSRGYGREMFKSQQKLKLTSADAIYCFVSGHCNNTQVTEKTTMQEAQGICNKLYGQRWTELGWKDYMAVLARALEVATKHHIPKEWNFTGWGSLVKIARHEAGISAMTACAMGNFQCDVTYCQMNYCHNDRFRAKFGLVFQSAWLKHDCVVAVQDMREMVAHEEQANTEHKCKASNRFCCEQQQSYPCGMEEAHTHDLPILPHSYLAEQRETGATRAVLLKFLEQVLDSPSLRGLIDPDPPRQQAILPREEADFCDYFCHCREPRLAAASLGGVGAKGLCCLVVELSSRPSYLHESSCAVIDRGPACLVDDIEQEGLESVSAMQLSTRFASHEAPELPMRLHQGLVDLRASMVLKQMELLRMVDRQLEEAKQVSVHGSASASVSVKPHSESITFRSNFGTPVGPEELQTSSAISSAERTHLKQAAPKKALRASTAPPLEETVQVLHAPSPRRRRKSFTDEDDEQTPKLQRSLKSSDEDSIIFENIVPGAATPSKTPKKSRTIASAALPSLSTKRRRMSWFTKQSERGSKMKNMQVTAKPQVARLSTAEKDLAEKEGQNHSVGLFGKYHNEYSVAQVRKNVEEGLEWDRMDSMRAENRCLTIVRNPWFERLTLSVIFLNAVEMAINAEFSDYTVITEADPIFIVAEVLFCIFFTVELVIRYATYISTCQALKDAWFSFDFLLVVLMIAFVDLLLFIILLTSDIKMDVSLRCLPTVYRTCDLLEVFPLLSAVGQGGDTLNTANALRVARVLRVLRTARMAPQLQKALSKIDHLVQLTRARLVKLMPELMILVKGMLVACRSVFFTLVLLLLITFVFSITFIEFSRGHPSLENEYFSSMGTSIMTLILRCVLPDQEVFFNIIASESWPLAALVLLFILLGSLTVMNMLLGVLVEAVKTVSTIEREQLDADFARKVLWELIDKEGDEDGDNLLSEKEFVNLLKKPKAARALMSLGVDVSAAYDYGKLLFEDGEKASFVDFMQAMLTLRGSNKTTVKDIVELRKFLSEEFHQVETLVCELCNFLGEIMEPTSTSQYATP
ncbi:Cacna1h, partial [Symbiodinium sp. CCMP2456]